MISDNNRNLDFINILFNWIIPNSDESFREKTDSFLLFLICRVGVGGGGVCGVACYVRTWHSK